MNADVIQALVARCLTTPLSLSTPLENSCRKTTVNPDPSVAHILECGLEILGVDTIDRLRLFRGFITKIKHNHLRRNLTLTLRLLTRLQREISFFALFSTDYLEARSSGPISTDLQLRLLEENLRTFFLTLPSPLCAAADDLLTHEICLRTMRLPVTGIDNASAPHKARVNWRGSLTTRTYRTDVLSTVRSLSELYSDAPLNLGLSRQLLAYWRPPESESISLFQVDDFTNLAFSLVNGSRSINEIAEELMSQGFPNPVVEYVENIFRDASARGMILS